MSQALTARPFSVLTAAAALLASCLPLSAADLDRAYPPPPPAYAAERSVGIDPRCRVIPQPELNLYGNTTRFRPTIVCMSRGLYADSFGPYPFSYPYYPR